MNAHRSADADLSDWALEYPLKEYSIPYAGAETARHGIESYIKGALGFPSCLDSKEKSSCELYAVNFVRFTTNIFYHAASTGMGKTRLHNELCKGNMEIDCGDDVSTKFVRFTYGDDTTFKSDGTGLTFIKQLLNYHGLDKVEADKTQSVEAGFSIFIKKLSESGAFADTTRKVLGVCVDDWHLGNSDAALQRELATTLMRFQDSTLEAYGGVRVMFFFTSCTEWMFGDLTPDYARSPVVNPGTMPRLEPCDIKKLLFDHFPDIKIKCKNQFVRQLVDLCCDIPRAAFDALPDALKNFTEGSEGSKVEILNEIMRTTQLTTYRTLEDASVAHFLIHGIVTYCDAAGGHGPTSARHRMQAGLAFPTQGGATLFPLVLRAWAAARSASSDEQHLSRFVNNVYDADCLMQGGSEVLATVLQNIEAAKLSSYKLLSADRMETKCFWLTDFYRGGISRDSKLYLASSFKGIRHVGRDKEFDIEQSLSDGYMVVFPDGEKALTHLIPFRCNCDTEFHVGASARGDDQEASGHNVSRPRWRREEARCYDRFWEAVSCVVHNRAGRGFRVERPWGGI